jgi:hypothetical protein
MSSEAEGAAMAFGFVLGGLLVCGACFVISCGEQHRRRVQRSGETCKPAAVLSADNGVAACSDGRVYRWREGYLTPVGRK